MKSLIYYLVSAANIICFLALNYILFEDFPVDMSDLPIIIGLELLILGNIYVCLFHRRHNLSFASLGNIWPFIVLRRITMEEKKKIQQLGEANDREEKS